MSGRLKITFRPDMPPASVEVVAPDLSTVGRVWLSPGAGKEVDVPSEGSFLRVHLASGESVTLKDPGNLDRTIGLSDLLSSRRRRPSVDASPGARSGNRRQPPPRGDVPPAPAALEEKAGGLVDGALDGGLEVVLEDDANVAVNGEPFEEGTAMVFKPPSFEGGYRLTLHAGDGRVRVRLPGSATEIAVRSNAIENGQRLASVRVKTSNAQADALAGYLHRGDLYSASSMADWAEQAEDLLRDKNADPFAAVVGAYLLLRMHDIARLHDWTANLMGSFPNIPDAVVIRAWHLIYRRGDEAEIRRLCAGALDGPLPIFTEGLRLLSDGVRLLGDESDRAVEKLNQHVRRSLNRSPFTATLERSATSPEWNWDVEIDYAPRV